ncbi:MAG: hypothetical protein M3R69_08250 [Acidobacteriota bacterium]|nr:hypothetical protein [Acidobacteriota bacterium]
MPTPGLSPVRDRVTGSVPHLNIEYPGWRTQLVAIFAEHGILRAETMRFPDELRSPADVDLPKKPKSIPKTAVQKFEKLISSKSKKQLSARKLEDEQTERLLKLVKKKGASRKNIVEVESQEQDDRDRGKVIDLVAVLKKSLAAKG